MPNFIAAYNKTLINLDHVSEIMPVETAKSFGAAGSVKRFDVVVSYSHSDPEGTRQTLLLKDASQAAAKAYMDALTANLAPFAFDWDMPVIRRGELISAPPATPQEIADIRHEESFDPVYGDTLPDLEM